MSENEKNNLEENVNNTQTNKPSLFSSHDSFFGLFDLFKPILPIGDMGNMTDKDMLERVGGVEEKLKKERRRKLEESGRLNYRVRFYDSHPGLLGCPVPLPSLMRETANNLNGKEMILGEGLNNLVNASARLGGEVEVVDDEGYHFISYEYKSGIVKNLYRLIRYRYVNHKDGGENE